MNQTATATPDETIKYFDQGVPAHVIVSITGAGKPVDLETAEMLFDVMHPDFDQPIFSLVVDGRDDTYRQLGIRAALPTIRPGAAAAPMLLLIESLARTLLAEHGAPADGGWIGKRVEFQTGATSFGFGKVVAYQDETETVTVVDEFDGTRWTGSLDRVTEAEEE